MLSFVGSRLMRSLAFYLAFEGEGEGEPLLCPLPAPNVEAREFA